MSRNAGESIIAREMKEEEGCLIFMDVDNLTDNDGVKIAIDRIFRGFFKIHGSGDLMPTYSVADFEGDSVETH